MNDNQVSTTKRKIPAQGWIALLAGLYSVSPIDVIPDFIPLIGAADDTAVIVLALVTILVVTLVNALTPQKAGE